jgi:hypothetical protein
LGTVRQDHQSEGGTVLDTGTSESEAPEALELDPFGFHPEAASRIKGVGGHGPTADPDYAFHTAYVEAAPGRAKFTVRFDNLQAKSGTLMLRVHMVSSEPGARARMVNSERIALNRLIATGGEISIMFEGFRDVSFALVGQIHGETDASAEGLTVTLDRPADPNARADYGAEARGTAYGRTPLRPAPFLLSKAPPSLADPVTQVATGDQLREAAAGVWMARLRPKGTSGPEHWRKVYTLQALRRYGMLEEGALGLGFERSASGIPAALAAMGTKVVAAFPIRSGTQPKPAALKRDLADRAPCSAAAFEANVSARVASWRRIPADLVNFDFLWSARANEILFSVAATAKFVEQAMACLRPGGLAVHTFSYDLTPSGRKTPSTERILLQQGDIERIALLLVSRGHEVAQFKIAASDAILTPGASEGADHRTMDHTMVGLIARKVPLPD